MQPGCTAPLLHRTHIVSPCHSRVAWPRAGLITPVRGGATNYALASQSCIVITSMRHSFLEAQLRSMNPEGAVAGYACTLLPGVQGQEDFTCPVHEERCIASQNACVGARKVWGAYSDTGLFLGVSSCSPLPILSAGPRSYSIRIHSHPASHHEAEGQRRLRQGRAAVETSGAGIQDEG
jgi:hypothetical protein